ncbi:hypothetical protein AB6A40_009118 [Gnathostoma spinigerum]|uniref:Uncharacterized protein n=1 Tax=Gnathostoma spinigerum TaxID=75299 RepID=A0ABD6ER10_9BILA
MGAVELLIRLRDERLKQFFQQLRHDEKHKYDQFCEIFMPRQLADPTPNYLRALERALRMPLCRLITFFAYHLKDLDAIVRGGMPNIAVIGRDHNGHTLRDQWVSDEKSDENHLNKQMKNNEFLDSEKLSLIAVVLDNMSLYHRHNRNLERYMEPLCGGAAKKVDPKDIRGYEPVQPLENTYNGISLVPLDTYHFDLDVIQRLHHGTTVIHLEPYLGRSTSCFLDFLNELFFYL